MSDTLESRKLAHFSPSQETTQPEEVKAEAPSEEVEVKAEESEAEEPQSNKELEVLNKRVEDSRKAFHNSYNVTKQLADRALENGWMEEDEVKELLSKAKSNDFTVAENPLSEIDTKFTSEAPLVAGVMGISEEDMLKRTEAFNNMLKLDPSMEAQLLEVPSTQMTKWILEKGEEFLKVSPILEEHGGTLGAIQALANQSPDLEALKEEIRNELRAEFEGGVSKKPNLSRTGGSTKGNLPKASLDLQDRKKQFFQR